LKFLSTFLSLFLAFTIVAQDNVTTQPAWDFVAEKPGIKVYTRTTNASSFKEIRIKADMEGQIDTLQSIVNDAINYESWVYKCSGGVSIKPTEGFNTAYAAITDFPFPMSDRELVAKSKQWQDDEGRLHSHTFSAPDDIPLKPGIVRIRDYEAKWVMEQIDENRIHVEYISKVDPGGNIPAWVVNLAITAGPIKTFEALMRQVKSRSRSSHTKASTTNQ